MRKKTHSDQTRPWKILAIVVVIMGLFTPNAMAINFQQWTSSILNQLKGNAAIGGVLEQFTKISEAFNTELKNVTGITDAAIAEITGQLGQLDPTAAKKQIEEEANPDNPLGTTMQQGAAAAATSANAGEKVLRKEAQAFDKTKIENLLTTASESTNFANETQSIGDQVQSSSSSQDVLKGLALQNNNRAKIEAAQVQMSLSIATDIQEVKTQLAASNQSMSELLKYQQGERQKQLMIENEQAQSEITSQYNNLVQTGLQED